MILKTSLGGAALLAAFVLALGDSTPAGFVRVDSTTAATIIGGGSSSKPCDRNGSGADVCCTDKEVYRGDVDQGTGTNGAARGSSVCTTIGGGGCTFSRAGLNCY